MPYIVESNGPVSVTRQIRLEAERRIAKGILVNGRTFRADDASTQRIGEVLQSFRDGLIDADGATFRTAAGDIVTLRSVDEARRVFDAQRRYRTACLASSAALQQNPPEDIPNDRNWPAPERVDL